MIWRLVSWKVAAVLAAAALCVAVPPSAVRSDVESGTLSKYDKPVDEAIDKALEYLVKQQKSDGSFGNSQRVAITGLSVMAFLAKGHTPGLGPYGDVINKGIDYVLGERHNSGILSSDEKSHGVMYTHGIATLMLSEVSGMVDPDRQKRIDEALSKAGKVILTAQTIKKDAKDQGGWRYQPNSNDSDISCTGWQLMSLRSARNNGAQVPREAIESAVKYILRCRTPDGGFAYQPGNKPGMARTGTALLCLELCGKHNDDAAVGAGAWLLKHLPRKYGADEHFAYGMYYASQGMFQLGGKYWEAWAENMYEVMTKSQNADGSWPSAGNEGGAGPCYPTAMGVLALSVGYRQLPIYQR
jgi:hypothetical protein